MTPSHSDTTGYPYELAIRIGLFLLIFIAVAVAEIGAPRRQLTAEKVGRWRVNLSLTLLDVLLVRLLFPILPVGFALLSTSHGWGALNQLSLPYWLAVPLSIMILDLVIYLQHVLFHMHQLFWRFHGIHHTDLDIDVTSGLRFHPLEIVLSMLVKLTVVAALGAPALAVLVFEVLLNGTSMFSHGNIRLQEGVDNLLRLIVVTPDMHRVHHSVIISETNSNFGFSFPWWDRFFGTYQAQPAAGRHEAMTIGNAQFRDADALTLQMLLALPFRRKVMPGQVKKKTNWVE